METMKPTNMTEYPVHNGAVGASSCNAVAWAVEPVDQQNRGEMCV